MKNLIILFLFILCGKIFAQDSIVYNFLTNKFISNDKNFTIESTESCRIKIINVNLFLYKLKLKKENQTFNATAPDRLRAITDLPSNPPAPTTETPATPPNIRNPTTLDGWIKLFHERYNTLKKTSNLFNGLLNIQQTDGVEFKNINQSKINFSRTFIENPTQTGNLKEELYSECERRLRNVEYTFKEIKNFNVSSDEDKKKIESIEEEKKEIDKADYNKLFSDISKVFDQINITNYQFSYNIVRPDGDNIDIKIEFEPVPDVQFAKPRQLPDLEFSLAVLGFKTDFSAGFFITNLINKEYTTKPDSTINLKYITRTDTINGIIRDTVLETRDTIRGVRIINNSGSINIGISTLAQFTWRLNPYYSLGFNAGIGVTNNDDPLKFMAGGSIIFRDSKNKQRFIVNAGAIMGSIATLSGNLDENSTIYPVGVTIVTKNVNKFGWFAGVGYNF